VVLLGVFIAAVLLVSRWHGLRSLIGLASLLRSSCSSSCLRSWPAQSAARRAGRRDGGDDRHALHDHGVNEMTTAAVIGTAASLILTDRARARLHQERKITGFASDDAVFARFAIEGLDLQGLVLAGLIIAALGVLDDVTVSQASTVFALHDTEP
jgi:uncharacterized membrane protein